MLRATFGIDPKLSNILYIEIHSNDRNLLVNIEFDTGEKEIFENSNSTMIANSFKIPINASKITITSDNNITHYGYFGRNYSIISIEEFISDSIIDCDYMFYGFFYLKKVKNINLNWDKITSANGMCCYWVSFDGILPDNFCSNMISLKNAHSMFYYWKSFNQELPKGFCSDMVSLRDAGCMFNGWNLYNQKLPDNFCSNMILLIDTYHMFYNWYSFNKQLPNDFFPDTSYINDTELMFWGWWLCNKTPKYKLPEYLHNYKQKDMDELNYLLEKHKEQIEDNQLMSKLSNKDILLCIKGDIDHYVYIKNGVTYCLYEFHGTFSFNSINEAIVIS